MSLMGGIPLLFIEYRRGYKISTINVKSPKQFLRPCINITTLEKNLYIKVFLMVFQLDFG
ncbi:hypothetical protein GIB67_002159 [Kingdonia uniflora]|uniref:Uncharacterized protein n=1 Tax=Kingdonia uniflora TaxID=39325 RepID=A0A7J7KWQ6_9MAGN|nr:hypothetical protein GIB67_002159 [Kingdonia uniflora]